MLSARAYMYPVVLQPPQFDRRKILLAEVAGLETDFMQPVAIIIKHYYYLVLDLNRIGRRQDGYAQPRPFSTGVPLSDLGTGYLAYTFEVSWVIDYHHHSTHTAFYDKVSFDRQDGKLRQERSLRWSNSDSSYGLTLFSGTRLYLSLGGTQRNRRRRDKVSEQ
ncbi:hypothetical protein BDP27DRAFT_1356579 [Rhodocollybia butyracea]|uniref:Uncharacterized protein n=1 Tax=Rhodocollybia butyracea TaxID=206335 RepID=A0A9P5UFY6_9AGAR|nr:hypothetical protein BDP27DRAFT_1356579 [Rhodocollybia butyracea]